MKMKRKHIVIIIITVLVLALSALSVIAFMRKDNPGNNFEDKVSSSEASSVINVDDIETEEAVSKTEKTTSDKEIDFIEPDETEADKILKENESKTEITSSKESTVQKTESKTETAPSKDSTTQKTESKTDEPQNSEVQSFDEGKKELENTAEKYLKANGIDPKTAGETGELCPNCSKKIWNPDKYGSFIPGMPEDYENSGYCLGTCGITFE